MWTLAARQVWAKAWADAVHKHSSQRAREVGLRGDIPTRQASSHRDD